MHEEKNINLQKSYIEWKSECTEVQAGARFSLLNAEIWVTTKGRGNTINLEKLSSIQYKLSKTKNCP